MIHEDRSTWTIAQLADEVIEVLKLPKGCRATIMGALDDAKEQGRAEKSVLGVSSQSRTCRKCGDALHCASCGEVQAVPSQGSQWKACDLCGNWAGDGYCANCKREVPVERNSDA